MHISRTPDVLLWFNENSYRAKQGKLQGVTGQKLFYRAKTIWLPMFSYDTWKCHFSQTIVFLRVNFKNGKIYRAKTQKISANAKLLFEIFVKLKLNWNEMNVILSFLKMWPFFTHWHPMFHYAQLHKKTHFCQFVWGDTQVHFQISLNVLYETIF